MHSTAGPDTQYVGGGAFFIDANGTNLYSFAGFSPDTTIGDDSVDTFNMISGAWSHSQVSGGPFNKLDRSQSMFAQTQASGTALGFMAGGGNPVAGMLTFNASDPQNLSWVNSTSDDIPFFRAPATEYVRFGLQGVLVSVGGYASYNSTTQREQRSMSAVQVYDIDSQTWFEITATGDTPPRRSSFCSGLSSAPDDSSFQMTIHGGYNYADNTVYSDIYVLTMPAFHWVLIQEGNNLNNNNPGARRRHLCSVYQDRQMLVLGGDVSNEVRCDSNVPPMRLLDTSTFNFSSTFPSSNTKYEVPPQVYNIIGGDANGGATKKPPEQTLTSTNQQISIPSIFSRRVPRSDRSTRTLASNTNTTSSGAPTPSSSLGEATAPDSNNVNKGTIAGGVVGGIVGITLIAAAATYLRRRHKQRSTPEWQKPELSAAGHKPQELSGRDAEAPTHAELQGVMAAELDAGPTTQKDVLKELPS